MALKTARFAGTTGISNERDPGNIPITDSKVQDDFINVRIQEAYKCQNT